MFEVTLSPDARDFYAKADPPLAKKLARAFSRLEDNPRASNNAKPLKGDLAGYWRYRVGDWRVVYRIADAERAVIVAVIAHRREVYELPKKS